MPVYQTPNVYIEEVETAAPLVGVGTSTAAFVGPCSDGPLNEPTRISSWDEFKNVFGKEPVPDFYLWYAVRGFFENGGRNCYITRLSNGVVGEATLNDESGNATLVIRARKTAPYAPTIIYEIEHGNIVTGALFQPTATMTAAAGARQLTINTATNAKKFRQGDSITWQTIQAADEGVIVERIEDRTIFINKPFSRAYTNQAMMLADPRADSDTLRMENVPQLTAGMQLRLERAAAGGSAAIDKLVTVSSVIVERSDIAAIPTTYRVTFRENLGLVIALDNRSISVRSQEFRLKVRGGSETEEFNKLLLGIDPQHPNYYLRIVNGNSQLVVLLPSSSAFPNGNRPNVVAAAGAPLPTGTADRPNALTNNDYISQIDALAPLKEVSIVAVPDRQDKFIQDKLVEHCTSLKDRFAVLDTAPNLTPYGNANSAMAHREALIWNKGYGALYYPWIRALRSDGKSDIPVPPSGHIAGIYARTDLERGVHKAPAGLGANIRGAIGVETRLSDDQQGALNVAGVNILRVFSTGAMPVVWGARTLASGGTGDATWQYVNVRRLLIYLETTIQRGLRGGLFEPNNLGLWRRLKRTLTDFLLSEWRAGALFGEKAEKAFYVRIDEALNPFSEQQLGRLNIEIGVRPSYPAEFIIVRIGIWDGGSSISEL